MFPTFYLLLALGVLALVLVLTAPLWSRFLTKGGNVLSGQLQDADNVFEGKKSDKKEKSK